MPSNRIHSINHASLTEQEFRTRNLCAAAKLVDLLRDCGWAVIAIPPDDLGEWKADHLEDILDGLLANFKGLHAGRSRMLADPDGAGQAGVTEFFVPDRAAAHLHDVLLAEQAAAEEEKRMMWEEEAAEDEEIRRYSDFGPGNGRQWDPDLDGADGQDTEGW